jgi:hypothetical protein
MNDDAGQDDILAAAMDAIERVLQWRELASSEPAPGWPDDDYRQIATAVLDAMKQGKYMVFVEREALLAVLEVVPCWVPMGYDGDGRWTNKSLDAKARIIEAMNQ